MTHIKKRETDSKPKQNITARPLHATPNFTVDHPYYLADNLHWFQSNTDEMSLFNAALEYINDWTLSAEVYQYQQASSLIAILQRNINHIQHCMWEAGALLEGASRCLEATNTLDQIKEAVIARQQRQVQVAQQEEAQRQHGARTERAECCGYHSWKGGDVMFQFCLVLMMCHLHLLIAA